MILAKERGLKKYQDKAKQYEQRIISLNNEGKFYRQVGWESTNTK